MKGTFRTIRVRKNMDTVLIDLHLRKFYFCKIIIKHLKREGQQILG